MLVIDYMRRGKRASDEKRPIMIAPYHRGHTGLLPGTPVNVALMGYGAQSQQRGHGVEVFVTPFKTKRTIFQLSVTLEDAPGVVCRLLTAVSSLNLNIILQESACINHQNLHVVNLLLDWSSTDYLVQEPVPARASFRIQALSEILPQDDFRYARLVYSILAYCESCLHWRDSALNPQRQVPDISISRPFDEGHVILDGTTHVQRKDKPAKKVTAKVKQAGADALERLKSGNIDVFIELPNEIIGDVERLAGYEGEEAADIPYILLSDGQNRTLRIFFPHREKQKRLMHCAFVHRDSSGALAAIAKMLSRSHFNIITSLLRRSDSQMNSWEVYIEHRDPQENTTPDIMKGGATRRVREEVLEWVAERLRADEELRAALGRHKVQLTTPKYPSERSYEDLVIDIVSNRERRADKGSEQADLGLDEDSSLDQKAAKTLQELENGKNAWRRAWVMRYVSQGLYVSRYASPQQNDGATPDILGHCRPVLFLSYPSTAAQHVQILKPFLEPLFQLDEFQDPTGQEITEVVIDKICEADFFLGIWQPEKEHSAEVSPWMTFEFGIARSQKKQLIIAVNSSIQPRIWKRIDPHVSRVTYSDLSFESNAVQQILRTIRGHWIPHYSVDLP